MSWLLAAGRAYLYGFLIAAGVPALLGDYLFYRSDPFSLAVALSMASLLLLPVTGLALAAIALLPAAAAKPINRLAALVAAAGIVDLFLSALFLYAFGLLGLNQRDSLVAHPLVVIAAAFVPAALLVWLHRDREGIIARAGHVGLAALACSPLLLAWPHLAAASGAAAGQPGRHLTLIVLDGWPSQYLRLYNPDAPPGPLDGLASSARVFEGAHTSAAWTNGYFGALYDGDTAVVLGERYLPVRGKSLGAALQERGVAVRFMNFHRNGMPDASAARRHDHAGLRSYFLTENYAWIPAALRLDYHIALSGEAIAQNFALRLPHALFAWLNPVTVKQRSNALTDILLPELRRLRRSGTGSFVLFHASWTELGRAGDDGGGEMPDAQRVHADPPEALARIRANEYRYGPDFERRAADYRRRMAAKAHSGARLIREFLDTLRADPALAGTTVVLTSDHGSIHGKGRLWYGYHPHREVVRVPFIVLGSGAPGRDATEFATPQITRAVLAYFDAGAHADFAPSESPGGTAFSLTLRSDKHRDWILVATRRDRSYWMNLHPQGPGTTREISYRGYEGTVVSERAGPPPALSTAAAGAIAAFGIACGQVHPAFC